MQPQSLKPGRHLHVSDTPDDPKGPFTCTINKTSNTFEF
jgi:hypothetical protein